MADKKEMYAWFSQTQKDIILNPLRLQHCKYTKLHTNIYLTENGKEVEVTEICSYKDNHKERFNDSIYLGKVVKWLRIHKQ